MPNYYLIEERMMKPFNPEGIEPNPNRKGFLDYLRELRQDSFSFPRGYKIAVEGLEDVLLAAVHRIVHASAMVAHIRRESAVAHGVRAGVDA